LNRNRRLLGDSAVNFISFGLLGLAGLAINYVVARRYGPEGLGQFNFAYSVYILLSQIAVGGSHLAILRFSADSSKGSEIRRFYFRAGLENALRMSGWVSGLFGLLTLTIGSLYLPQGSLVGFLWIAPGVFCFSITKCYINYFNGVECLRVVGLLNSARSIILFLGVLVVSEWTEGAGHTLVAFFVTELIIAAVCIFGLDQGKIAGLRGAKIPGKIRLEVRSHCLRVLPGNIMADVNSRVDVIMLGILVTEVQTGIYSLPAMLVDGMVNFTIVLRTIINGKLGRLKAKNDFLGLKNLFQMGILFSYVLSILMAAVLYFLYPVIVQFGNLSSDFLGGRLALLILLLQFGLASGFLPFAMAPNQFGQPGIQTMFYAVVFGTNLVGNCICIPIWGIEGAAAASGLSFIVYGILIFRFYYCNVFSNAKEVSA
jgi:stage V sporulation protein B